MDNVMDYNPQFQVMFTSKNIPFFVRTSTYSVVGRSAFIHRIPNEQYMSGMIPILKYYKWKHIASIRDDFTEQFAWMHDWIER
jgi:hypothetical protein